ncbi:stress-induced protein sti1 family protein, putative, partial [Ichthyophthirius multifiliis]
KQKTIINKKKMSLDQATEYKNQGNKAFQENRFEEAVDLFTKAIQINPNDHVYYSNRSGAYASKGDLEKALEDANKCIQLKPDWAKGYQRKGHAEYELGKLEDAVNTYKKGLEYEPNNTVLKERLQNVQDEISQGGSGKKGDGFMDNFAAQIMMKLAMNPKTADYLKDPSFMQKLQMLQKNPQMFPVLMQQDPRLQEALNIMMQDFDVQNMANKYQQQKGKPEQQQQEEKDEQKNQNTEEKKSQSPQKQQQQQQHQQSKNVSEEEKLKLEGNEYYKKKQFDKAQECYDKAISINPKEVLLYNNKAAVYIETNQYQKAIDVVNEALKICEDHQIKDFQKLAKLYARKGACYAKLNDYKQSIEWYQKSLLEDFNGKVKLDLKAVEKLQKELEQKAFINPQLAEEHNEKAKELFKQGKYPDAMKEYDQAVKRNPSDPKYICNRGICYVKLLEFPTALKDFEHAIQLDSKYVKAYLKKGNCHHAMKEYHKAIDAYEKGLKLEPDNQELKTSLAQTQQSIYVGGGDQKEQEERAKHAMADPEIQQILMTPEVQNALKSLQQDPKEAIKILQNPTLAPKINKLIQAGILRMG